MRRVADAARSNRPFGGTGRTAVLRTTGCAVTVALAAACAPGEADDGTRAYVERLGNDTVFVERYERTAEGFEGDLVLRSPATRLAHYSAALGPDGTVETLQVDWRTPPENPEGRGPQSVSYTIRGDSAMIERSGGRSPGDTTVAVPPDVIPTTGSVPHSYAVLEQAIRQAMAAGGDSVPIQLLTPSGRVADNVIRRVGGDTLSFNFFGSPLLLIANEDGRILARSGARTTMKVEGRPVDSLDVAALASDFAARDARGEGFGVASPTATVEATVDGASLSVTYSRPAKRGREIWGGLVPYDEVWRTGANAATAFSTDRALEIGGVRVPAGDYTLYSIYTEDSAKLIINEQTGQWGTVYDQEQDLARVDMTAQTLEEPVERFRISIEDTPDGGVLQLVWDRTRYEVPIRVL